jgi:NTE family protein
MLQNFSPNYEPAFDRRNEKNKTDIYIKPDITEYGVISFDKGKEIIEKGEEAFLFFEKIKELVSNDSIKYRKPKYRIQTDSLEIKSINITELDNFTYDYVLSKLRFKPGSAISYKQLEAKLIILIQLIISA